MKKFQHGGRREGAGRKKKIEGRKLRLTVSLSEESLDAYDIAAAVLKKTRSEVVDLLGQKGSTWITEVLESPRPDSRQP